MSTRFQFNPHAHFIFIGDYADKMNFTLLQYASFQFYTQLSERKTRVLLIAMAWLLATEDVLILAHRMKLCKKTRADRSIRVYRDVSFHIIIITVGLLRLSISCLRFFFVFIYNRIAYIHFTRQLTLYDRNYRNRMSHTQRSNK